MSWNKKLLSTFADHMRSDKDESTGVKAQDCTNREHLQYGIQSKCGLVLADDENAGLTLQCQITLAQSLF